MVEKLAPIPNPKLEKTIQKNLILFFTGSLVSNLGTFMYNFAIGLYVLTLTGSGKSFAISILFGIVPRIILSPFAGALADKINRKTMTVCMDIASGILLLCIYFITQLTELSLMLVYISSATLTVFNTFFGISINASIPNLVDDKRLVTINSLRAMVDSGASIAGPMLGGLVYSFIGIEYFLLLNGISFICSGISELFIDFNIFNRQISEKTKAQSLGDTLREGFKYLKQHELILGILKYALFLNFIVTSVNISLPYTSVQVLGASSSQYGFIQMGFPAGILIMSIIYTIVSKDNKKIFKKTTKGMFRLGIVFIFLGLPSNPLLSFLPNSIHMVITFIVSALLGMIIISINIPIQVMMQTTIDDAYRGRVSGVISMMSQAITPLGIILFGFLVDQISSYLLPIISGILILAIGILMMKDNKMLQL
ncbi:MAG: MFS transporter [Clostridiales bacterium]|nr:MFS transporter [Clostridiales bacterium]